MTYALVCERRKSVPAVLAALDTDQSERFEAVRAQSGRGR